MEEYLGTIKMFAGVFAPRGFMFCNGAILSVKTNTPLFAILGNAYGGDGITTFALPNLNGRAPFGAGNSNTGINIALAEAAGTPQATILPQNLPSIVSQLKISNTNATSVTPSTNSSIAITGLPNGRQFDAIPSFVDEVPTTQINANSVSFTGQNVPVDTMAPYLGMNYIICVEGLFPPRT
ncbi:tail fiber protein [Chryseobacterium sp. C39-AII1]|uniref:phage tail protein n=1 Tax=Chryseobacterium sp. C39-AII1 TaxID=3080332 RepID=UPI00320B33D1